MEFKEVIRKRFSFFTSILAPENHKVNRALSKTRDKYVPLLSLFILSLPLSASVEALPARDDPSPRQHLIPF